MASHTRRLKKGGSHSKSHKGRKGHKGGMVHRKSRHTRGKKRGDQGRRMSGGSGPRCAEYPNNPACK